MKNESRHNAADKIPFFIRWLERLCSHISYKNLHRFACFIGTLAYYLTPGQRKRVMSNLAIAEQLNLSEFQMKQVAKASFQNLYRVTFDYLKLRHMAGDEKPIVHCENPEVTENLRQQGQGMILYTGHLANWEMTFLEESQRMPGMMVAQRFFVEAVAEWIDSIRCQFGGITVTPEKAVVKGMKALRNGEFVGVAGDQALPEGSHYYDFLGSRAWTTVTPAVWAYRSNSPIITVLTRREGTRYITRHGEPIWPDLCVPFKVDVSRMMKQAMAQLEQAVIQRPGEYLWLHNRWRQDVYKGVNKRFQHDFLLVVLPEDGELAAALCPQLQILQTLYPRAFITLMRPGSAREVSIPLINSESGLQFCVKNYTNIADTMERDWRYQLLINFTESTQVNRFYRKLAVREVIELPVDSDSVATVADELQRLITV